MPAATTAFYTLIVEDDPSSSDVIARAIRRAQGDAVAAMSAGEALLRIEDQWPPSAILDLLLKKPVDLPMRARPFARVSSIER